MVAKESRLPHVEAEACNASEACSAIADSIRHAPLTAALVGFGAGLALGCIVVHAVKQKRGARCVGRAAFGQFDPASD